LRIGHRAFRSAEVQTETPATESQTNSWLRLICEVVKRFSTVCRLQEPVAPGVKYSFDYFIPSENTAVEIALSLRNIVTEFEKDIFKAILANKSGKGVKKLVLIGKDGSVKRQNGTGPNAIKRWVSENCGIEIQVKELK